MNDELAEYMVEFMTRFNSIILGKGETNSMCWYPFVEEGKANGIRLYVCWYLFVEEGEAN